MLIFRGTGGGGGGGGVGGGGWWERGQACPHPENQMHRQC